MTSDEIKKHCFVTECSALEEIAYQLAVMNENKEKESYKKGWNDCRNFFFEKVLTPIKEKGSVGLAEAWENIRIENERKV